MSSQIKLKLVNFKCFKELELTLHEGINFFSGNSGTGKTTVNKAIYFCFYGGRKFKNVQNRDHKDKSTMVSIYYWSQSLKWMVTRTRPSESVIVEVCDSNGSFTYKDSTAQDWINKRFGIESIWLSSSYIGVTRPHFLISGNSNADKIELLQRIAYGDSAPQNQPETYITAVKSAILYYGERFKQLNESIKVNEGVKQSYQTRNPALINTPYITEEETMQMINQRNSEKLEIERLRTIWLALLSKKQFTDYLLTLPKYSETIEEVSNQIELLISQQKKMKLKDQLIDFNSKIYSTDIDVLSTDHFLYGRYISEGWNKKDLSIFLSKIENSLKEYEDQQRIVNMNNEISNNNKKKEEINKSLLSSYDKKLKEYNSILTEIESYNKRKEEIEKIKLELGIIDSIKLSDDDDMSSSFVYKTINSLTSEINNFNLLISKGKKHNYLKDEINSRESKLILPTLLDGNDDKSVKYLDIYRKDVNNQLEDCKKKIIETEEHNRITSNIESIKNTLVNPTSIDDKDDCSVNYILLYRENTNKNYTNTVNRIKELNELKRLKDCLNEIDCCKITDDDDMTLTFLQGYRTILMMELEELICPCCQHGLRFENGVLIQGTTVNNSENSRSLRTAKIELLDKEKLKRLNRDKYIKDMNNIQDGEVPNINDILNILEKTNDEYNIRIEYNNKQKEIVNALQLLSKLKFYNIDDFRNNISECETNLKRCESQYMIRQNYISALTEINRLNDELCNNLECNIEEYQKLVENNNNKLTFSKLELEKRMKYDDKNKIISSFESIVPLLTPDLPLKPELMDIQSLIEVKNVTKPSLNIFDKPFYSYDEYIDLWRSNGLRSLDLELKQMTVDDYKGTLDELNIKMKDLLTKLETMKKVAEEKTRYETMIKTMPQDDPHIEQKCANLCNSVNTLESKILLSGEMKEIKRIETSILQFTKELNSVVEYLGHFNYYYSTTEELGMIALEERINDINTPLKEILDSLFDEPISVKISPFKELKNGNTKLQVNLVVEHRNSLVDDYDDECSTGQIGRVSIALLLAFARNNNNPFIIIDEVLSSVEPTRQSDILDVLPSYGSGKFIINICHGVAEGNANNVIYFKDI